MHCARRAVMTGPTARYATPADLDFVSQDGYVARGVIARKIAAREVVIAERAGTPVGYARIEYLWSRVPYLALIRVVPPQERRRGTGRALLGFVEQELAAAGHRVYLSSSQADEGEPQAWHLHMGFVECGRLTGINDGDIDEIFYRKPLDVERPGRAPETA